MAGFELVGDVYRVLSVGSTCQRVASTSYISSGADHVPVGGIHQPTGLSGSNVVARVIPPADVD
jgi:hypothetical protein